MIEKKLIRFNFDSDYQNQKQNIKDTSIVFIDENKKIVTHGTEYQFIDWSVLKPSPVVINFSIEGVVYQGLKRMTWGEWVDSEYNSKYYINSDNEIQRYNSYAFVIYALNNIVYKDHIIEENHNYAMISHNDPT